mmetsp:Transcript_22434/g.62997  ORF Transcript_22434/g.62997 Transcript_22434/m.62997 type:complete len:162 (-) Transcript_22434:102-587(-)
MSFQHDRVIPDLRAPAKADRLRKRENSFTLSAKVASLPEYNPMFDVHLRHLWVNPRVRTNLQAAGFIDEAGNPVDVDAHRRKLYVIEQELAQGDAVERNRELERERKQRDRMILARRQEVKEQHLRAVRQIKDGRRRQESSWGMHASGSRSAGSLPAISGQ